MTKFIHAADIHLDSPLKGLEAYDDAPVEEIRGATRKAFVSLVDFAIEEEIDFMIVAGDLYDGGWKDYNTGLFFAMQMGRLESAGIKVFVTSGNHDSASRITKNLPLPENVKVFSAAEPETVVLDEFGVMVHGQSYKTSAVTENIASTYPLGDQSFFNIGILHTSLTGRVGHENYAPCSLNDLKSKGYDYWALGHVHNREVVCDDPVILFPGNIQGRHIRETGAKGATLVSVEDGQIRSLEAIELDELRWSICTIDVSDCETREEVYTKVKGRVAREKDLQDNRFLAIRLVFDGASKFHMDFHSNMSLWTEEFKAIIASIEGTWIEKVKFQTRPISQEYEDHAKDGNPFAELLGAIEGLEIDDDLLNVLVPDIARLKTKLPAELLVDDSVLTGAKEEINRVKEEVKQLLASRLTQQGGGIS